MRPLFWAATLIVIMTGTAPCFGQSKLTSPVEVVDVPIAMKYGEISSVHFAVDVSLNYYKNVDIVRTVEDRFEGDVTARLVGSDLELSMAGYTKVAVTDQSQAQSQINVTCLMRTTGEQLKCDEQGNVTYPLFDRPSYKTGDTITLPFGVFNGADWYFSGVVKGKSQIGQRPVLVIEFASTRKDRFGPSDVESELTGFGYLDMALGHPHHLELTADFRGPFNGFDRMRLVMRLDATMPGTQQ